MSGLSGQGALQFTLGRLRITVIALGADVDGPTYSDELDRILEEADVHEVVGLDKSRRALSQARIRAASDADRSAIEDWSRLTPVRALGARGGGHLGRARAGELHIEATPEDWANGLVIGRDARCTAHDALSQYEISRVHAVFLARGGRCFVVDAGSTNGTTVVGRATGRTHAFLSFDGRVAELTPGLLVVVGDTHVVVNGSARVEARG